MINKVILQGRLARDPEVKEVGGFMKAGITVAWSEKYKETETKCFLNCEAWRGTADFINKYFLKGQEILIEGRMVTDTWEKDGQKQSRTYCLIEKVNFCGSKSSTGNSANENQPSSDFVNIPDGINEELPFE